MTILSGTWTLTAIENEAGWQQGILIQGSEGFDGIHAMTLGSSIGPIQGSGFEVRPYAFNPTTNEWEPSIEQSAMSWDAVDGVTVIIRADDNPAAADGDFNDLVVRCTCDDPPLRAPRSNEPELDLTIPEYAVGHRPDHAPWDPA